MVNPVPGVPVSTEFGRTSSGLWTTCGYHTGVDFAAPAGTPVVAARPGKVTHVDYGSSFGAHQVAVRCSDGTEDFYAHMSARAGNGLHVQAGDRVGEVGDEGNSTGPHLHFERHTVPGWSCDLITNPQPSLDYQEDDMPLTNDDIRRIWEYQVKDPLQDDKPVSVATLLRNTRAYQGKLMDAVVAVPSKVWGWLIKDALDGGERKPADTILANIRAKQGDG